MNQRLKSIENLLLFVNLGIFLFLALCFWITTHNIVKSDLSTEFMFSVNAIVFDVGELLMEVFLCCMACVLIMVAENRINRFRAYSDFVMGIILFVIVAKLGFNYNGVFLYLFSRVLSDNERNLHKNLFLVICAAAFIITDRNVMDSYYAFFSIDDYIQFYHGMEMRLLTIILAVLQRVNSLIFIFYCATYIRVQYENIRKINCLYNELEEANSQLMDYAFEREKYGEINERNRIAREIHDTLGHTMTTLSYGLQAVLHLVDRSVEDAKEQLYTLNEITTKGIEEIRRSVRALSPHEDLQHQLPERIQKLIASSQRLTNIQIHYSVDIQRKEFQEDEALVIYRVIQESMTNCFKHSQAENLDIHVMEKGDYIEIHIQDDGIGFIGEIHGFGTTHMRQRVELLGGSVIYNGTHGFETRVHIPLRIENEETFH